MNDELKDLLSDSYLSSAYGLGLLKVLFKQYEEEERKLNETNKKLRQSLSDLEVEIQFLSLDAYKKIKDYYKSNQSLEKAVDQLFDDLLDDANDEVMNDFDKLSFNIGHVKHVEEVVTLLRHMMGINSIRLLEIKDMLDFLKKKKVNWARVV